MKDENKSRDVRDTTIEEVVDSVFEQCRRGLVPTLDDFLTRYPHLSEQLNTISHVYGVPQRVTKKGASPTPDRSGSRYGFPFVLGEYRILREIGRGGMGIVYEAEQVGLGRRVALKILPFHSLLDEDQHQRFHREARAAAKLHHTHIAPVHGVGEYFGIHYYAMQYIEGEGLDVIIKRLKTLRTEDFRRGRPGTSSTASVPGVNERGTGGGRQLDAHDRMDGGGVGAPSARIPS